MIYTVIITKTETADEVRETVKSVCEDSDGIVLVCDRNEGVSKIADEFDNVTAYNINQGKEGRLTSTSRNFGLKTVESLYNPQPDDVIVFFDGDRKLVKGRLTDFTHVNDIELIKLEDDFRDAEDYMPYSKCYGETNNGFNSNGLMFKYSAVKKVVDTFGFFFPEQVQQVWGIEDRCLGDMCFHLNLKADYNENMRQYGGYSRTYIDVYTFVDRIRYSVDTLKLRTKFSPNI